MSHLQIPKFYFLELCKCKLFEFSNPISSFGSVRLSYKGLGVAAVKMVQTRELCGNITTSVKGKYNFKEEYINRVVSEPAIWRYSMTENIFSWTFEQADIVVNMPYGDIRTDLLISGDFHGSLRITSGGSVYVLSLSDPLVLHSPNPVGINLGEIASCTSYIWTADCNFNGSRALIGTNGGVALVHIETGSVSWACHFKSDVNSVQLDNSENIGLCGLVDGTILSVDIRQRPESNALLLPAHSILLDYGNSQLDSKKRWFKLHGNIYSNGTISTSSSITCLTSLKQHNEYYFLASSLDGCIKLYDHRMVNRGAVLSYEGNARLHTRIQHVVDPSEKFIMTGGIDKKVRLWSIKSGELLFEKLFMDFTPSQFCWGKSKEAWVGSPNGLYSLTW
ncbi:hypothetical protein DCAR_0104694 [Daucus carota subsp. sativus]|uniref:Uncharacterized protein n=1 Tax=Daucus carota subsp. sativus TaxID=79200 RepID=A0AAF0W8Z7_DAUCS|nr:hypothetical protein DCAR_0104694 [Daucus carota subsp. sativus]